MLKAAVYSPYWDTLGGGEKYLAAVILTLKNLNYQVEVFWHQKNLLSQIQERYHYDLTGISINQSGFRAFHSGSTITRLFATQSYHLFFYVSDGSFPFLFAKKNLLHFQVPFTNIPHHPLIDRIKKAFISQTICNSKFTKRVIDSEYNLQSKVLYPPATTINPQDKQPYILSVGRFDNLMHSKRQDVLIKAFSRLQLPGWKLVLAGGVLHGKKQLQKLKAGSRGQNIQIITNPTWTRLSNLYAHAGIYWHAAGYGFDLNKTPQKAEHFGISTVEAMSAGAVPIVYSGGGLPEIVSHGQNGYLWQDLPALISLTKSVIDNAKKRQQLSLNAQKRSHDFSLEVFQREFKKSIS